MIDNCDELGIVMLKQGSRIVQEGTGFGMVSKDSSYTLEAQAIGQGVFQKWRCVSGCNGEVVTDNKFSRSFDGAETWVADFTVNKVVSGKGSVIVIIENGFELGTVEPSEKH